VNNDDLLVTLLALDSRMVKEEKANSAAIQVPAAALLEIMTKLKNDPLLNFDMLLSHTAVHWLTDGQFELLYRIYSTSLCHHLLVTTRIPVENPTIESLYTLWRIAEFQEREVYDLFGVLYSGHPDLRRLFLEDDWQGFPLRKDYKDDFMLEGP
jgi:NADH-quinone oxidoreductase subunit C